MELQYIVSIMSVANETEALTMQTYVGDIKTGYIIDSFKQTNAYF